MKVYLLFLLFGGPVIETALSWELMAEGREQSYLSPLEEQILHESDSNEDLDQELLREREIATHRLWVAFQDSATAVAHLFRG